MENLILLAAIDFAFWKAVLLCAIALGLIIFVHELGHFMVAKACGVRCDKFYLGFDFFGMKLLHFKWGETEYGIGVFPLGGYVKMLGQEDNPGETRQRIEKAKEAAALIARNAGDQVKEEDILTPEQIAEAEKLLNDPRSYQAKSVPQRMAIIVAGVTMNVIFAFICAIGAYLLGTETVPCVIGNVMAGQSAWEGGLQADDRLLTIAGNDVKYFSDIQKNVMLGDNLAEGIQIVYQRDGFEAPQMTVVYPKKYMLAPMLGAANDNELVLVKGVPVMPTSALAYAKDAPKENWVLCEINGTPVSSFLDYLKAGYKAMGERVTYKFAVPSEEAVKAREEALKKLTAESSLQERKDLLKKLVEGAETHEVTVEPTHARHFGVIFEMGEVQCTRLEENGPSSARKAGIVSGDKLVSIEENGEMAPIGDPMTLVSRIHQLAKTQDTVKLTVLKKETGKEEPMELILNKDSFAVESYTPGSGIVIPEIGLAYLVSDTIAEVMPGSEAEKAGLAAGDKVDSLQVLYKAPENTELTEHEEKVRQMLSAKSPVQPTYPNICMMPMYFEQLQYYPVAHTSVVVQVTKKAGGAATATLPLCEYENAFVAESGMNFQAVTVFLRGSLGTSIVLGGQETWKSLTLVFRTLGKLFEGQVSTRGLGGPILIAKVAYGSAKNGMASLLLFCCLISANLAVMNILPIPVLDGGHVVFLLYEGITGRAPNENLMIGLTYAGLLLFLFLLVYVCGLDLGLIPRM